MRTLFLFIVYCDALFVINCSCLLCAMCCRWSFVLSGLLFLIDSRYHCQLGFVVWSLVCVCSGPSLLWFLFVLHSFLFFVAVIRRLLCR